MPSKLGVNSDEVLDYIKQHLAEYDCVPKLTEIAHRFKITPAAARYHLLQLERNGKINFQPLYILTNV